MAEFMEDTDTSTDADRQIDSSNFRKDQFDIFKHDFLESFDEAGYEKLENLTLDPKLKKEVVNMARRLQKASNSLKSLGDKEMAPILATVQKIDELFKKLVGLSKESSEYSALNIRLPEYSEGDMKMFMGDLGKGRSAENVADNDPDGEKQDPVKWLCQSNEEFESQIKQLLGAGEILMNEYYEIRRLIEKNA